MMQRFHVTYFLVFLFVIFSCKEKAKKPSSVHKYTNALVNETSPYLLQHAHNPVNWRPWSQEALDKAKKENKLVLVSIGYSSCHWCHVMEEETFEDEEVAKIMNDNFISIKVDREERPDIDNIYQTFVRLIDSNSGWPLNVITLPNGKPLYGNTYHTKNQWMQVLSKVSDMYTNNPEKAAEYSDMVAQGIQEVNLIAPSTDFELLNEDALRKSVDSWKPFWDLEWGGDQGEQKFMIPVNLDFLMDYALLAKDDLVKAHVKNTLDKIISGGIYDHIGGGFFRYSTDTHWKVPHFEKMLYDNAQALSLYSKAFTVYNELEYRDKVLETIAFLEREMKHPKGGYYAAIDADSEGEEGKFYTWGKEELQSVLDEDFELFAKYYNIRAEDAWEEDTYVLHKSVEDADFSKENDISRNALNSARKSWKEQLLEARKQRISPGLDDKVITSWNALLINGFVDAYKAFGQRKHLEKAKAIFRFLTEKSYQNGELIHSYKEGGRHIGGFLEDYAFLADASLNLYGVTLETSYLDFAQALSNKVQDQFLDQASGMYHYNKNNELIARIIKTDDGVLPSPNAVMAHNLFILGHLLYDTRFLEKSKSMLSSMMPSVGESAASYSKWNTLLLHNTFPYYEIAVVGKNALPLVNNLNQKSIPNTLVVGSLSESDLPLFKDRYKEDGTFVYVCQNSTCKLPVKTVDEAMVQLRDF
ncbi:thioredoxin domain-containing protein [Ulvibacterium marinum]|uniref:thioredoxin domain-containing protein n=1 Tax=Ulvibacterium marinum TaxID=2419782 RepID=UPI0024956EA7|nr:thioredoxin domain-containing protein [Ulvibacterium marinum]